MRWSFSTSREHTQQRTSLSVDCNSPCSLAISGAAGPGWLEERVEQVYKQEEGYSETATALFLLDLGPPQVDPLSKFSVYHDNFRAFVRECSLCTRVPRPSRDALDGVLQLRLAYSTLFKVLTGSQPSQRARNVSEFALDCKVRARVWQLWHLPHYDVRVTHVLF